MKFYVSNVLSFTHEESKKRMSLSNKPLNVNSLAMILIRESTEAFFLCGRTLKLYQLPHDVTAIDALISMMKSKVFFFKKPS